MGECYLWQNNNCMINYRVYGNGIPIIFLHGYRLDKNSLEIFFEKNANYEYLNIFKRFYIDLPGMGKSTPGENISTSVDILNCLNEFITDIIGNETFFLVGQSYGGYLAQGLLNLRSEQIGGVFLMCPVVKALKRDRILPVKTKPNIFGFEEIPQNIIFEGFMENNINVNPENWARYQNEIVKGLQAGNQVFLDELEIKGYKFEFEEELSRNIYKVPAYILLGKQDSVVGYLDMSFFLSQFTNCNFHVLNEAGHNIQIDQSNLVIQLFDNFLNQVIK